MAVVTIDSSNIEQVLADSQNLELPKEDPKPDVEVKPDAEPKVEAKVELEVDPDDVEGEDGLTPRQKRDLSKTMLKAIGKKHRELKEAEEFAASQYSEKKLAEQRVQALERELQALKGNQPKEQPADTKPKRENFATESEYLDAAIQWGVQEGIRRQAEEQAKKDAERAYNEMVQAAQQRIAKAIELVPDFVEVTEAADLEVPPRIARYMQGSDLFAELGYHFAKNPDLLLSLSKLPEDQQLVKLGKIESTLTPFGSNDAKDGATPSKTNGQAIEALSTTGLTPSKARSSAPVIKPLSTNGTASVEIDPKDMNIRETIVDWQKRNKVNLGLRKRH